MCQGPGHRLHDGHGGKQLVLQDFAPMDSIPSTVSLTTYNGGPEEFHETPLNDLIKQIEKGKMHVQVGRVFYLDEIVRGTWLYGGEPSSRKDCRCHCLKDNVQLIPGRNNVLQRSPLRRLFLSLIGQLAETFPQRLNSDAIPPP
jgi:hypothetical protein